MTHGTSQPTPQPSPGAQPWPEGVAARYLTVGGALVDLRHDSLYIYETEPNLTIAQCGGCDDSHTEKWAPHAFRSDSGSRGADSEAGTWAQAHAEKCRALPHPAVSG